MRDALVRTAVDMLRETGVEIGLAHLRLSAVIGATGVSRSTAYRSLADAILAPQEVLHRDVMTQLLIRDLRGANRAAVTSATLVQGMAMRYGLSDHLSGIMRPTGRRGELEEWTLCAVTFEAVYTTFFEPIDEEPFADLLHY